ncbi:MAG: DUF2934 domain-containing protein [Terracidiphilus sp.]
MTENVKKVTTPRKPRATSPKEATPKKRTTKGNLTQMNAPQAMASPEEIARLAHQYWAERGHQHGHHEEDWFRAEQELLGKAS